MCVLAVDRWPPSLARSLPLVRQAHLFCLVLQWSRREPPLSHHISAEVQALLAPWRHIRLFPSHAPWGAPAKPAGLWTGRYHHTFAQVSQGEEARRRQLWSSAAHFTLKVSEIFNSTGPQRTMGAAHQEVRCHKKCLSSLKELPVSQDHTEERLQHLMSLTYRAAWFETERAMALFCDT